MMGGIGRDRNRSARDVECFSTPLDSMCMVYWIDGDGFPVCESPGTCRNEHLLNS